MSEEDLAAKLAAADSWVREEFDALAGVAEDLGCHVRSEGRAGRRFVLGNRTVVRLHPKLHHLAVGLPEAMRADVAALLGTVRDQRGSAWVNAAPDVFDRDDLELLIAMAAEAASAPTAKTAAAGRPARGPSLKGPGTLGRDEADLVLLLSILKAYVHRDSTVGIGSSTRVLREAIYFVWEGPRLPPGRKYATTLPHTPAARQQRDAGDHRALVYEHAVPARMFVRRLLNDPPANTAELRRVLAEHAHRVIVTAEEDRALTAAGWREKMPDPDDRWSRYRAIGLDPAEFGPWTPPTEPGGLA